MFYRTVQQCLLYIRLQDSRSRALGLILLVSCYRHGRTLLNIYQHSSREYGSLVSMDGVSQDSQSHNRKEG